MFITKKHLSRRTMLRGMGAALSLPLLDSMVPALAATRDTVANAPTRLGFIYVPHGAVLDKWIPKDEGRDYTMSPTLKTLERHRDNFTVITNLDNSPAAPRAGEPLGGHANISGAWLSGVHAKPTEGADIQAGVTIDQIAARRFEKETQLASLELAIEPTDLTGACDVGFSCAYVNTVSWKTPNTPLPTENNPRALFERLFGDNDTTDAKVRMEQISLDRSILDAVSEEVSGLQRKLGKSDQAKLDQYLSSVRDIERRIERAEEQGLRDLPEMDRPTGAIPESYKDHVHLMYDLQVMAYQTDMTRVITFMQSREVSQRTYPEIGVPEPHHPLSHHQNKPGNLVKLAKVNCYFLEHLGYYLDKLAATPDGDGTLLDHMMLMYGSGMGDSNLHAPRDLPILLCGGGNGTLRPGNHLRVAEETPLSNLYVSMLHKLGLPGESIGNSSGGLEGLSEV